MKRLITLTLTLSAALVVGTAVAQGSQRPRTKRPAHLVKPSGGLLFSEATGKHICVLNMQKIVPPGKLAEAAQKVKIQLHSPIEIVNAKGKGTMDEKIDEALKNPKVGTLVAFVEDDKLDPISYFPDRNRCIVNVRALTKDGAGKDKVIERAGKQMWRSIGMVLGAGEAVASPSILQKVSSLEQLDAIRASLPSPEQHNSMVYSLGRLGIEMVRVGTYRDACRQGWAPAPTNDVQKAIWDEIHAIPQKPIKIEYNEKRDKGK